MSINRHNYEEFFILYLDNELSAEQRAEVEIFVQSNPDLGEELVMLQQSKLIPDNNVVYDNKENLMMVSGKPAITTTNYEEWLLLYIDNELSAADRKTVETFVSQNPAIKEELSILQNTILQPEAAITFTNKESLYRKEEKERRVIIFRWRQLAVAAILLFVVGTSLFLIYNNKKTGTDKPTIANVDTQKITTPAIVTDPKQAIKQPAETITSNPTENPVADVTNQSKTNSTDQSQKIIKHTKINDQKGTTINTDAQQPVIASTSDNKNVNNIPDTRYTPRMQGNIDATNTNDLAVAKPLTNSKGNYSIPTVTPDFASTLNNGETANETDQPEKKNKLRGLLRKVTRTFEKATNIKATDENDRLLVGGLAIQL